MKDEKQYTEGISVKENGFLAWLDNFWYHYKWATMAVIFFAVVFSVCIIQSCSREPTDILVTYAGPVSLKSEQKLNIEKILSKYLPADDKASESAKAGLSAYYVMSQQQIEQAEKQTEIDEDGEAYQVYVDTYFISQEMDSFESQLMTGSGSVILVDRWIYDSFLDSDGKAERLMPLSEVLGETPDGAIGAYGIRLGDTDIYRNNPQLQCLPADTVLCLHAKILGQKDYDAEIEAFKALAKISAEK